MNNNLQLNSLTGNVLTQLTTLITDTCYIKSEIDSRYYTKTATDALLLPITDDVDNLLSGLYRPLGWTGGLVIEYPQIGGLGVVNHLDETVALYDVNDISFYKTAKCFAGAQIDTLSGGCLTQIDTLRSGKENLLSSGNTINVNVRRVSVILNKIHTMELNAGSLYELVLTPCYHRYSLFGLWVIIAGSS
jgi:hypothetical protein